MVLLIGDRDIDEISITPEEVIEVVEDAYRQEGAGKAFETPRLEIRIKGRHLPHIAPGTTSVGQGIAYLMESKALVVSHAYHFAWNKYVSQILDPDTGETLALIRRGREALGVKSNKITCFPLFFNSGISGFFTFLSENIVSIEQIDSNLI